MDLERLISPRFEGCWICGCSEAESLKLPHGDQIKPGSKQAEMMSKRKAWESPPLQMKCTNITGEKDDDKFNLVTLYLFIKRSIIQ